MVKEISMFYGASPEIFQRAKLLRNHMTEAEKLLWKELKENKSTGFKFRRQHPINQFIVDFYCHKKKIIIELYGEIHENQDQKERDEGRQFMLEEFGLKVIRFRNEEVMNQRDWVLDKITKHCND
jgi:very-short-patch-repair endonuclease